MFSSGLFVYLLTPLRLIQKPIWTRGHEHLLESQFEFFSVPEDLWSSNLGSRRQLFSAQEADTAHHDNGNASQTDSAAINISPGHSCVI